MNLYIFFSTYKWKEYRIVSTEAAEDMKKYLEKCNEISRL